MTTEESLMRAVVEAAREWRDHYGNSAAVSYDRGVEAMQARRNLAAAVDALAALDAHRAEPAGEVVEVVAHVRLNDARNAYIVSGMGALNGRWQEEARGNTIATLTARVPLPTIPTIAAEVVR